MGSTVFPSTVTAVIGEEVFFHLSKRTTNLDSCILKSPNTTVTYILLPFSNDENRTDPRISYWGRGTSSGECGVRIQDVALGDTGHWRLTSKNQSGIQAVGLAKVLVLEPSNSPLTDVITLLVDMGQKVSMQCSNTSSRYCLLVPPGADARHYSPGPCTSTVGPITRADVGNWTCLIGVSSTTIELARTIMVKLLEVPSLMVGWRDSEILEGAVDLSCNFERPLSYCRFVSPNGTGIQLTAGLGKARYSYYGDGLEAGHCGLTIEDHRKTDHGLWKCDVGIVRDGVEKSFGGYINFPGDSSTWRVSPSEEVVAMAGSNLTVSCHTEAGLSYCWLQHPNGSRVIPENEDRVELDQGVCSVTLPHAQPTDGGRWDCHMGVLGREGQDLVARVTVRVVATPLAARLTAVEVHSGASVELQCRTVPPGLSLAYCRFVMPNGTGLSVAPDTTSGQLRYSGRGLDQGECGLVISITDQSLTGTWTCAGRLKGHNQEAADNIYVAIRVGATAAISWSVGIVLGLLAIGGVAAFWITRRRRQVVQTADPEELEMAQVGEER